MSKYEHLFFDLDNTLWDFDRNSREVLFELFEKYRLKDLGIPSFEFFIGKYQQRNAMMWEQYGLGKIDKATLRDQRFMFTFWDMGIDPSLVPADLAKEYISKGPKKANLFPGTIETLYYLKEKYVLHIITNGFEEAQTVKMETSGLNIFFSEIIISEHTGYKKPDKNIFEYAMQKAKTSPEKSLMIGDGLHVDIKGARNAGMDQVFFNPNKISHDEDITYEIYSILELKNFL